MMTSFSVRGFRRAITALVASTLAGVAACGSDTVGPTAAGPGALFWTVVLNHHAATLSTVAPYDTLRLEPTPYAATGAVLTASRPTRYAVAQNDTSVIVDSTGLLRANSPTSGVWIIATATVGNQSLQDSIYVAVDTVAHPSALATLSATLPADTAACPTTLFDAFVPPTVAITATDADGNAIPSLNVAFFSSDPSVAKIDAHTGALDLITSCSMRRRPVTLYAKTTYYGVTKTDSIVLTVVPPAVTVVAVRARTIVDGSTQRYFDPGNITIRTGSSVAWWNGTGGPIDIVFDDPTHAVANTDTLQVVGVAVPPDIAGNIPVLPSDTTGGGGQFLVDNYRARRFPVPGTYHYHSATYSTGGTIVVSDPLP